MRLKELRLEKGATQKEVAEFICCSSLVYSRYEREEREPDIDRAINQLQELYQKGYIDQPSYDFSEAYDENGNPVWYCECSVGRRTWHGYHSSKKQGKKSVAYSMLCDILGLEEDDEA